MIDSCTIRAVQMRRNAFATCSSTHPVWWSRSELLWRCWCIIIAFTAAYWQGRRKIGNWWQAKQSVVCANSCRPFRIVDYLKVNWNGLHMWFNMMEWTWEKEGWDCRSGSLTAMCKHWVVSCCKGKQRSNRTDWSSPIKTPSRKQSVSVSYMSVKLVQVKWLSYTTYLSRRRTNAQ